MALAVSIFPKVLAAGLYQNPCKNKVLDFLIECIISLKKVCSIIVILLMKEKDLRKKIAYSSQLIHSLILHGSKHTQPKTPNINGLYQICNYFI